VHLLVIEDEVRIGEILRSALQRVSFTVDVVRVCSDAREALALTAYDAAILDLGLPDGDGLALLSELRTACNGLPILILTARDAVEDRVSGLDTGADDYLVKPFAIPELIARTRGAAAAMGRSRSAHPVRPCRFSTSEGARPARPPPSRRHAMRRQ
jgi:DNA-binding response OmpR family regulator